MELQITRNDRKRIQRLVDKGYSAQIVPGTEKKGEEDKRGYYLFAMRKDKKEYWELGTR